MGMAVEMKEISFDTMQQELQIGAEDVEAFVIDGTTLFHASTETFELHSKYTLGFFSNNNPYTTYVS